MPRLAQIHEDDSSLAIRAAWLHYVGGMTQSAVANRLGVANVKAHRLINRATQEGAVKVMIDGNIASCMQLEEQLIARFGLSQCEVTPDIGEIGLPLRSLGIVGSSFLRREIENGENSVIGVGHGRTLAAAISNLPPNKTGNVRFVSLLGGLTRNFSANPHDVIHHLATKTSSEAFVMPVPFFANTVEDREVLLAQRGVREVFELAEKSKCKFVGIGTTMPEASLVQSGMISVDEVDAIKAQGGVGELLGHFFSDKGEAIETGLTARTLSVGLECLKNSRIVAIAGAPTKVDAIRSVLLSGYLDGLITDERTAKSLIHQ